MKQHLFVRIMNVVEEHDDYFIQKRNATGTLGLSCLQKVAAAFKMIAYEVLAVAMDDYVRVGVYCSTMFEKVYCCYCQSI
jgi:hypothetical protein